MDINIWNGLKNGLKKMINKIINYFNRVKWNHLKWKKIGKSHVGKNFAIISPDRISIGENFYAEDNLKIQAWKTYQNQTFNPFIDIGANVSMMENCHISCCNRITIGDGCLFGANVFITDNFHGDNSNEQLLIPPINRPLHVKGEVKIGKNVWVGRNVCITPGVCVGDYSVIGANAVVTKDIPDFSVAVGVPARIVNEN